MRQPRPAHPGSPARRPPLLAACAGALLLCVACRTSEAPSRAPREPAAPTPEQQARVDEAIEKLSYVPDELGVGWEPKYAGSERAQAIDVLAEQRRLTPEVEQALLTVTKRDKPRLRQSAAHALQTLEERSAVPTRRERPSFLGGVFRSLVGAFLGQYDTVGDEGDYRPSRAGTNP